MSLFGNLGSNTPASSTGGGLFGSLGGTTANSSNNTGGSSLFGTNLSGSTAATSTTGGLFGNTGANNQPKPNLFGGATTSQPAASGGLFGGLGASTNTSQPASTGGGLFGGLAAAPKPAPSGGLFGNMASNNTGASQPAGGSLFGGLGASTAQPANNSLFAGLNQSQQPAANQQAQGQGQQSTIARANMSQSAYFDQLLERGKKRGNQENGTSGDLPSLQLGLGDIARKVRNLGSGGPSAPVGKSGDTKAHYLLAASGVSTASALRDLNNFSAQAGNVIPPTAASAADQDIDAYLADLNSRTTMELIQEGFEQSKRDFDLFLEENVQMNWEAQRRKIYEHFGLVKPSGPADDDSGADLDRGAFGRSSRRSRAMGATLSASGGMSFGPSTMTRSVLGSSTMRNTLRASAMNDNGDKAGAAALQAGADERYQRDKQEKYAEKLQALNSARNQENAYPLIHAFAAVEDQAGIDSTAALTNSYQALINIVGEPVGQMRKAERGAIKERHYRDAYLSEPRQGSPSTAKSSLELRQRIIDGSRTCLEQQFLKRLETTINKDPKIANLGGVPMPVNKVRAYLRILAYRKELGPDTDRLEKARAADSEEPDYIWGLLYYLVRSGLVAEAAQYVRENPKPFAPSKNFIRGLEAYVKSPDRRLPLELRNLITTDHNALKHMESESSKDPFKIACYKLVGRCDLGRRTLDNVRIDEEDWLWLQFALARETSRVEENAGEAFGLDQLQQVIRDIGQRHFVQNADNAAGYGTFFYMQILAGMFEQAIAWLYPRNHVSAVHFAIALDYYGLLRVADMTATELLTFTTTQKPRLHFPLMLGYYTSDFRASKPTVAVDYLLLLALNADLPGEQGRRQAEVCYEALRELVLETREFAQLLGDIRTDGQREAGAIQQRLKLVRTNDDQTLQDNETFLKNLTMQAASAADESGRTTDAVLLYHLAGEYDTVLNIANRALSEALTVELGGEPLRLEPLKARDPSQQQQRQQPGQQQQQSQDSSTLSLTAVSDPLELLTNMATLYSEGSVAYTSIKRSTFAATSTLRRLGLARARLEQGSYISCLQAIESTNLLPLNAKGDMTTIRSLAANFSSWPAEVARVVGDVLMWTIECCREERLRLARSEFEDEGRRAQGQVLLQAARDLMVFAGLIRFKLSARVFEALASAGQDLGV